MKIIEKIKKIYSKSRINKILRNNGVCSTYFGMPGAGKTTFCAYIVKHLKRIYDSNNPKSLKVYSNVPIHGAIQFNKSDFGRYDFSNAVIILDECSLYYDGRNFAQNFNQYSLEYLKLLRHRNNYLLCFSQSLDIDIKFIRMSVNVFQIKKTFLFHGLTSVACVKRKVDVDENTHKFEDFYYKTGLIDGLFSNIRFWRRPLFKMFNSYEAPYLPKMDEIEY